MGNTSKKDARRLTHAEKSKRALELRLAGRTLAAIGQDIGVSEMQASRIIRNAIDAVPKEAAQHVLAMELARLDEMLAVFLPKAKRGCVAAADRVLRIQERRARYLGLDSATKTEVSGVDGAAIEINMHETAARVRGRLLGVIAPSAEGDAPSDDSAD